MPARQKAQKLKPVTGPILTKQETSTPFQSGIPVHDDLWNVVRVSYKLGFPLKRVLTCCSKVKNLKPENQN